MTQPQLAERMGITGRVLQEIELGNKPLSPDLAKTLEVIGGIPIPIGEGGMPVTDGEIPDIYKTVDLSDKEENFLNHQDLMAARSLAPAAFGIIELVGLAAVRNGRFTHFYRALEDFLSEFIREEKLKPSMQATLGETLKKPDEQFDFSLDRAETEPLALGADLERGLKRRDDRNRANDLRNLKILLEDFLKDVELYDPAKFEFRKALEQCKALIGMEKSD